MDLNCTLDGRVVAFPLHQVLTGHRQTKYLASLILYSRISFVHVVSIPHILCGATEGIFPKFTSSLSLSTLKGSGIILGINKSLFIPLCKHRNKLTSFLTFMVIFVGRCDGDGVIDLPSGSK